MAGFQGTGTRQQPLEGFRALAESERRETLTTITGTVVSYDKARQKAVIKPSLSQTIGGQKISAPDLREVPVSHPRAGGVIAHSPLKPGDGVILHVASRSLDNAVEGDGSMDHHPGRMHDLSDAIATPAAISKAKELPNLPDGHFTGTEDGKKGLNVKEDGTTRLMGGPNGQSEVSINPSTGKIDMRANGESQMAVLRDIVLLFKNHLNSGAPVDAASQTQADAIIARITALGDL